MFGFLWISESKLLDKYGWDLVVESGGKKYALGTQVEVIDSRQPMKTQDPCVKNPKVVVLEVENLIVGQD